MAQLAKRWLLSPEIRRSNPDIGNYLQIKLSTDCRKDENKQKEAENGPFKKNLALASFELIRFKQVNQTLLN